MASTSETGHAKNAANFNAQLQFLIAYGATYNPSKNELKIPQLTALYELAVAKLNDVIEKTTIFNNAVNERIIEFSDLKPLATRLVNALQTTDASDEKIKDAKGYNRKMQGKRASKLPETQTDTDTPAPKTISSSQLSYDQLIQHFTGLISVLESEPSYAPNETDLQIVSLTSKLANLISKNNAVAAAYTIVSNSRIARNKILYNKNTGLVDTAIEVKKYIKSVFGASSPEFAQVKSIEFKNEKI